MRNQLLVPLLNQSTAIWRATGFFASSSFASAPDAWRSFFERGGKMLLVCSPRLAGGDVDAIVSGLTSRREWIGKPAPTPKGSENFGRLLLRWGVANGSVHIRIARVLNAMHGLYHEKFGVAHAVTAGDDRAFVGSVNESGLGYDDNFELAHIYDDGDGLVGDYRRNFEQLWENRTPGLDVRDFHQALTLEWIEPVEHAQDDQQQHDKPQPPDVHATQLSEILIRPPSLSLRRYQLDAIEEWFKAGGRGIYAMATGTGKTVTSLATALRLYDEVGGPLVVIVVAPYLVLVDQWIGAMREFGLDPIRCASGRSEWEDNAVAAIRLANRGKREVVSLVCSNATFATRPMQQLLARLETRTLLIVDEVHNFGAASLRMTLPHKISLRLGLSATPQRHHDPVGTEALLEYFGEPVFQFDMRQAMAQRPPALVPYNYYPIEVEFSHDEYTEYKELTARIGRALAPQQDPSVLPEAAKHLLMRRARLVGAAQAKLPALRAAIHPYREHTHTLVYCGDGSVDASDDSGETDSFIRQVDAVVELLGKTLGMTVASYTSRTPPALRRSLLQDFRAGRLQCLVAIRCLDEGLDVPEVRRAFILASSSNPRQFIQRRGRVLRPAAGKEKAEIFDFFVVPPWDEEVSEVDRQMVRAEMARAVEFMKLAINTTEARHRLWDLLTKLHLLDTLTETKDGRRLELVD